MHVSYFCLLSSLIEYLLYSYCITCILFIYTICKLLVIACTSIVKNVGMVGVRGTY